LNGSGVVNLIGTTSNTRFTRPLTSRRRHHSSSSNIFLPLHGDYIQMSFFLGTPKWESQNFDRSYHSQIKMFFQNMTAIFDNPQKDLSNDM
jgi:hypothetical protein